MHGLGCSEVLLGAVKAACQKGMLSRLQESAESALTGAKK